MPELDEATAALLPAEVPGAPWRCRCDALVWLSRPRGGGFASAGALIAYRATPVGQYREVLALTALLGRPASLRELVPRLTVPFIAVDSPASIAGGRRNWALPKEPAQFTGDPGQDAMTATGPGWSVTGPGWSVTARARPLGPWLPVRFAGRLVQRWPDGTPGQAAGSGRARVRLAAVRVGVEGRPARWVRAGSHLGFLVRAADFTLGPPVDG